MTDRNLRAVADNRRLRLPQEWRCGEIEVLLRGPVPWIDHAVHVAVDDAMEECSTADPDADELFAAAVRIAQRRHSRRGR